MTKSKSQDQINNDVETLTAWNEAYRNGTPLVSDKGFDELWDAVKESAPWHPIFKQVGLTPLERKAVLPVPMYSMDKLKTIEELNKWQKTKHLNDDDVVILTPKYDGISLVVDESKTVSENGPVRKLAWTRGDGQVGQASEEHLTATEANSEITAYQMYSFGEIIMQRNIFDTKYAKEYSNGRNLVAGKFNASTLEKDILKDIDYVRYGLFEKQTSKNLLHKSEELDLINELNKVKVPYIKTTLGVVTHEYVHDLYNEWSKQYEIDGIILDIEDRVTRVQLGRESNMNPAYARALKFGFEQIKYIKHDHINLQVSRNGKVKPVANLVPTLLEGVIVKRATLHNFKFAKQVGIITEKVQDVTNDMYFEVHPCNVEIVRSGQVIPKVLSIDIITGSPKIIQGICPSCGENLSWDKNHVDLICTNHDNCSAQRQQKIIHFIETLKVRNFGDKAVIAAYEAGIVTSIKDLINMDPIDIIKVKGLGIAAMKIISNLQSHLKNDGILESTLMDATCLFNDLGERTLRTILEHLNDNLLSASTVLISELCEIEGVAAITAKSFKTGYRAYSAWIIGLGLTVTLDVKEPLKSTNYASYSICMSGVRDVELKKTIEEGGGKMVSGVTKKTTHLIVKSKDDVSTKITKAGKLGVPIYDLEEFKKIAL